MSSRTAHHGTPKVNLYGSEVTELRETVTRLGAPSFHASQIYRWLYAHGEYDVRAWTDLPLALRRRLAESASVEPGALAESREAPDGTVKYRVRLAGGGDVEAVFIPHAPRVTLCLSSQHGCALGCDFCLTARMGLLRHLRAGEIVGQVALIQRAHGLEPRSFNLVFMGMGEPLHNYGPVMAAFRILTDDAAFGLSWRRITVSTSGLAPAIERLAAEPRRPRLAVSLNATTDAVRDRLMPINRRYPIDRLLDACRTYRDATGERLTLEYVLLRGVNDSEEDLRRLPRLARRAGAKVNLIPFNPVPGRLPYSPTDPDRVLAIRDHLLEAGLPVSVRWSRGAEVQAACGQLAVPATPRARSAVRSGDARRIAP